jgi:hypothetical protein
VALCRPIRFLGYIGYCGSGSFSVGGGFAVLQGVKVVVPYFVFENDFWWTDFRCSETNQDWLMGLGSEAAAETKRAAIEPPRRMRMLLASAERILAWTSNIRQSIFLNFTVSGSADKNSPFSSWVSRNWNFIHAYFYPSFSGGHEYGSFIEEHG